MGTSRLKLSFAMAKSQKVLALRLLVSSVVAYARTDRPGRDADPIGYPRGTYNLEYEHGQAVC